MPRLSVDPIAGIPYDAADDPSTAVLIRRFSSSDNGSFLIFSRFKDVLGSGDFANCTYVLKTKHGHIVKLIVILHKAIHSPFHSLYDLLRR